MKYYSTKLREDLTELAVKYAKTNNISKYAQYKSAIVFESIEHNFHPNSHNAILKNTNWRDRLTKTHQNVKGALELHSSNSSDGLLMNVFCHPKIKQWKSIANLFEVDKIASIEFGHNPNPPLLLYGKPEPRPTEVDLVLNKNINCEAKLTETDFTSDNKDKIEAYENFADVFHKSHLPQTKNEYFNYQLIRNILAAYKEQRRFILLCDMRRPDLIKSFYQTVMSIKDVNLRRRCSFITWQDISKSLGSELKIFLDNKYGIR